MTKASDNVFPRFLVSEGGSTTTPAAGNVTVYAKADGLLYSKDDAGTETLVSGGSSGSFVLPTFVAIGVSASGTGDITPGLPAGGAADDILLLFVQSNNQAVTAPAGYTQLGPQVGIGTAAAAGGTRLATFWKRNNGAEAAPTVTDTGDHTLGQIMAIRGCTASGDPFISVGQTKKTTASVTGTAVAGATHLSNCLVVNAFAHSLDSAVAVFSSFTNASLTSVTERIDVATADGNGGGIGVSTGSKVTAGSFVATTVTETSTTDVSSTFYLIPTGGTTANAIDRQVFITPGTDTWTQPSGAKSVDMIGIGGGASGSAGRNAATAAGGGGGGGGHWERLIVGAAGLAATTTVVAGAGGAATANTDGAAANAGVASTVTSNAIVILQAREGRPGTASASGAGGDGGSGGGRSATEAASTGSFTDKQAGGGTGGTTAGGGGYNAHNGGGAGAGGGTTQGASAGGSAVRGGGGGGGGRAAGTAGTGGGSLVQSGLAGGASTGANGTDSPYPEFGGSGAAGGIAATGPGGTGGWPGGGGGGGGSQSGAQRGGAGGDGVVVIVTTC